MFAAQAVRVHLGGRLKRSISFSKCDLNGGSNRYQSVDFSIAVKVSQGKRVDGIILASRYDGKRKRGFECAIPVASENYDAVVASDNDVKMSVTIQVCYFKFTRVLKSGVIDRATQGK